MAAHERPDNQLGGDNTGADRRGKADQKQHDQVFGFVQADIDKDDLEGDDGKKRADRVVDNGFPAQQRSGTGIELGLAQQRHDHRRAGDHEDGAQHNRRRPAQSTDMVSGKGGHAPGHRSGIHNYASDSSRGLTDLLEIQRQPAFKQDDGHSDRDHRPVDGAEIFRRVEKAGGRTGDEAGCQQQHDGRQLQPPGKPLRGNAGCADHGKFENDIIHVSPLVVPPWRELLFEQVLKLCHGVFRILAPGNGALEAAFRVEKKHRGRMVHGVFTLRVG